METKHNLRKALLVADGGSTKTDWCLAVPHREPQLFRTRGLNPALLEPPAIREILQTELLPRLAPPSPKDRKTETHIYYYGAGCLPSVCDKMGQALTGLFPRSTAEVHSDLLGLHGPYADTKPALPAFWAPVPIPAVTTDRTLCNMCLRWDTS